jgi:hypothetical protein
MVRVGSFGSCPAGCQDTLLVTSSRRIGSNEWGGWLSIYKAFVDGHIWLAMQFNESCDVRHDAQ